MSAVLSLVAFFAFQPAYSSELFFDSKSPQARKILFIGDSLTFVNQLPLVLAALIFDSNTASELRIGEVVQGGASLETLYEHTDAVETVEKAGPWTDIVLQEQSDVSHPERTRQYAMAFAQSARKGGARTLIFETWCHSDKTFDQPRIKSVAEETSSSCGGSVVFVGEAFDLCRRQHPEINLYTDDRHPTQAATYLAACVFYAKLYGRTPVGLPNVLTLVDQKTNEKLELMTVPQTVASSLQRIALDCSR